MTSIVYLFQIQDLEITGVEFGPMSTQAYSTKVECPDTLVSGETVRGIVILTLNSPAHINSISVGIIGTQATVFTYCNMNGAHCVGKENETLINKNVFFLRVDAAKEPGEYVFEFVGKLPEGLLPSVKHRSKTPIHTFYGQRQYSLSTIVDIKDQENHFLLTPVSVKGQPMSNQDCVMPISATTTNVDLVLLCCINRGRVVLSGIPESPCLKAGDKLKVKVCVDNTSQVDQTGISCRLFHLIGFQLKGEGFSYSPAGGTVSEIQLCPLVAKGTKFEQLVEIPIPEDAMPSFENETFSSKYTFFLEAESLDEYDWKVKLPIKIFS
jgi:hypothetical protein